MVHTYTHTYVHMYLCTSNQNEIKWFTKEIEARSFQKSPKRTSFAVVNKMPLMPLLIHNYIEEFFQTS